jgi:hypothetical protein
MTPQTPKGAPWSETKREFIASDLFISARDLFAANLPPPGFLVNQLIPDSGVMIFYGNPGEGKTWLAYELIRAALTGSPWMERSALAADGQSINALVCNYEQGTSEVKRRFVKLGLPASRLNQLHFHTLGFPVRTDGRPSPPVMLRVPEDGAALRELIEHHHIKLVLFDSMRQAHKGDENDSQEMGAVMAEFRAIASSTSALLVLIHHSNKMGGSRGSGEVRAAIDCEVWVKGRKAGDRFKGIAQWKKTRGWDIPGTSDAWRFEIIDEGSTTKVRFTEPVPGLSELDHHLKVILDIMKNYGKPVGQNEIMEKITKKHGINRLELSTAVRYGKQRGLIVPAPEGGKFGNRKRIKLKEEEP